MAYSGKSIKEIMNMIGSNEMFLPSIQRKFVWDENGIEKLLDSIMLGYPIGTFLFWKIKRNTARDNKYILYTFINNYSTFNDKNINEKAPDNIPGQSEYIYSVLDGQQRLTSLYIAFYGSIELCKYGKSRKKAENYIEREMYLNLNKSAEQIIEDEELRYEFKFLSEEELKNEHNDHPNKNWFKVKEILQYDDITKLVGYITKNNLNEIEQVNLSRLFEIVRAKEENSIISYFEINENTPFEDILNIFVRVNDGGKKLSKSDLLFSTIVSTWEKGRKEIESLILTINNRGERYKFDFNNDFIMRCCLYIVSDSSDLKIENLGKENLNKISAEWGKISESIITIVDILCDFGFCSENLISKNAVMPLVYYVYSGGKLDDKSKSEMRKYLIIAQLKKLFGASGNSALIKTKKAINEHNVQKESFSIEFFRNLKFVAGRDFSIKDEDLEGMLDYNKGSAYAFMVLSLLYPELKLGQVEWHQDHMHPQAKFKDKTLKGFGLTDEQIINWKIQKDKIPNLQLLEGRSNKSKNDMDLEEWLKTSSAKYLPNDISYKLENFEEFFEKRKCLLKAALNNIFNN